VIRCLLAVLDRHHDRILQAVLGLLLLALALLCLAGCGRDDAVPAARAAESYHADRATAVVAAAESSATARHLDDQAARATDPAQAARLRAEADQHRLRAEVADARAAALAQLAAEAEQLAIEQRAELDARAVAAQQAADRRWAWILAAIGTALCVAGGVVAWRLSAPLWIPGAGIAGCWALAGFATAAPWLAWVLGGAVVLAALAVAGVLLWRLWRGLRAAGLHADRLERAVLVAVDADRPEIAVRTAVAETKRLSLTDQTVHGDHATVQAVRGKRRKDRA
jgi:hypothetical protein